MIRHLNDFTLTGIHIFKSEHGVRFQLRRWAMKIMSLVISAIRLFILTRSQRLRNLLDGKFEVQVLSTPTTIPYLCNLSSETIQMALDAALAGPPSLLADLDKERGLFIERLVEDPEDVVRQNPIVHAELAMVMAMDKGEINHVFPYIGVSKLSCIMCSYYIHAFNEVTGQKIATKGYHEKAYPGWFWPSLPSRDEEVRPAFLIHIRQQLRSDFEYHAETRTLSDSSIGSGAPGLKLHMTDDELSRLIKLATGM